MECPVARGLERVGEWWSILILRDALQGLTRFDQFQKSLEIAPNILARRLASLVQSGLLEKRLYSERPPRYEYVPTAIGRDFQPVLMALLAWGNRHFAPEGARVVVAEQATGRIVEPAVVDPQTGKPLRAPDYAMRPGPLASEALIRRLARGGSLAADAPAGDT